MNTPAMQEILALLEGSLTTSDGTAKIIDEARLQATIHRLAEVSAL